MMTDPYKVLGIQPGATDEEITKAYRRLAKKYHPDVNRNNPEAARRMSEINAAYDMIREDKDYHYGSRSSRGSQGGSAGSSTGGSGYGGSRGTAEKDNGPGSRYDPFGGFWPFGSYGPFRGHNPFSGNSPFGNTDPFTGSGSHGSAGSAVFDPVRNYLKAGYYREALNVLAGIADRAAEWYYYSAIANLGAGNRVTALNHAAAAARMEPDNADYASLFDMIQNGARTYQKERQGFGLPVYDLNKVCIGLCLARICCLFCWR